MTEVHPVHLELAVVIGVNELVSQCVLHVLLVHVSVLTQENTVLWREAASTRRIAWVALHC